MVHIVKIAGKSWSCNLQCQGNPKDGISNCCSEIFIPVNPDQRISIENNNYFIAKSTLVDWEWLKLHDGLTIEKLSNGDRKISVNKSYTFKFNLFMGKDMLYIEDRCKMLLKDGRCKIYRARPQACRKAECPVYSNKLSIRFYAQNGVLKNVK